jgi:hypothetical protein
MRVVLFSHKKGTGEVFLCLDLFDKIANFHVGAGALDSPHYTSICKILLYQVLTPENCV